MIYTKCFSSPIHLWHTTELGDFDRQDSVDLVAATVVKGPAKVCKTSRMLGWRARAQGIQSPASSNSYLYDLYVIYIYVIIYIYMCDYIYIQRSILVFSHPLPAPRPMQPWALSARCVASCTEVTSVCAVRTNSDCLTAGKSPRGPQGAPRGPQRSCWAMNLANSYVYR